ncbi:hypothetical protein L3X38_032512 [Prunus dulcis]|uniref:DDE Tnp4 domain-containing protein n=1 Tax=Prunus dulcis TaxID=3755 RepID=A0AAD4YVZ5_PRUDU|nr:hypothetical protein L3X38_032512 [Prunus dulcis]
MDLRTFGILCELLHANGRVKNDGLVSLLRVPEPVGESCTEYRWKCVKNCLGALDGTYFKIHVLETNKPRYQTRKGEIATNVLVVCSRDMQFIFVLPGWEGSASDSQVLRDAITRPNGLKVPTGYYYLVDGGYTNVEGDTIGTIEASNQWTAWRDDSALQLYNEWRATRNN